MIYVLFLYSFFSQIFTLVQSSQSLTIVTGGKGTNAFSSNLSDNITTTIFILGTLGRALLRESFYRGHKVLCGLRNFDSTFNYKNFECNLERPQLDDAINNIVFDDDLTSVLLINNAAVCVGGNSLDDLKSSLAVNTIAPIKLSWLLAEKITQMRGISRYCIINVSSGDGELLYLNSQYQDIVKKISKLHVSFTSNSIMHCYGLSYYHSCK